MTKKSNAIVIFFIVFFGAVLICDSYSQIIPKTNYIIFSFERSVDNQENENYYWIIPIDSITDNLNFAISPLFVEAFSQFTVDRCAKGDSISFFKNFEGVSEEYESEISKLMDIIKTKKSKIQKIIIQWDKKGKNLKRKDETISIYATPISGVFCNCLERHEIMGSGEVEFRGLVYIPMSDFLYYPSFWGTENERIIMYADYSLVNFVKFTPYMYQKKNRVRAR